MSDFIEELGKKSICIDCIGDSFVKEWILKNGNTQKCSYCKEDNKCMSLKDICNKVDGVYRENYELGEMLPSFFGDSDKPEWERSGDFPNIVISNLLNANELIAEDILTVLADNESYDVVKDGADPYYESSECYVETPIFDYLHSHLWNTFCDQVKHQSRFFNVYAGELLDELFTGILDFDFAGEVDPFRIIDKKSAERFIYRSRQSKTSFSRISICTNPIVELASPPKRLAIAGRMNPAGIPIFYGALDRETCLSELRLSVGDLAISGKFEITRPLRIMDLSVFDKLYQNCNYSVKSS